jgi:DNA helicase-4
VLVARAGWLLTTGEAVADQILLLAFGRKAAQEMDERIQERLHTQDITARTFHALALHIIQQGSKKVPSISKLENDTQARQALFIKTWRSSAVRKRRRRKGGVSGWRRNSTGMCRRAASGRMKNWRVGWVRASTAGSA